MANSRTYQIGCSRLTIEFGNLTTSTAQVLVSSDDYYLSMGGGASASILRAGGPAIALDAAKKVPAALGDIVVTTAGTLPAQYIFHAITIGPNDSKMSPKEIIKQTTSRCMKMLDALHLSSIAFPAIGAGVARFSYEDVAVQMAEVISEDLQKRQTSIDVTLYLFDRFGRMQTLDFIQFFEEFSARVLRLANHAIADTSEKVTHPVPSAPDHPETDEQIKMRRQNNIRKLIGSLEDKRFELEARLIELINSGHDEKRAELRQKLVENQELRLGILNELQNLSQKGTSESSRKTEAKPEPKKAEVTVMEENYIDFDLHVAPNGHVVANSLEGQASFDVSTEPPNDIQLALKLIEQRQVNLGLLRQVGQSLYGWLFPAPIHTHFQQTEAVARRDKVKLRLRMRIEAETIACLPLEFLYCRFQSAGYVVVTTHYTCWLS